MTVTESPQLAPPDGSGLAPSGGPSLSPSRAADFKTCPLLFRFRTIDKLPEQPSADQVRGTLVHAVLERLFDLPAAERTPEAAAELVAPEWARLVEQEPRLGELFAEVPLAELEDPQAGLAGSSASVPAAAAPPSAPSSSSAAPPSAPSSSSAAPPSAPSSSSAAPSSASAAFPSAAASSVSASPASPPVGPHADAGQPMLDGMPADETARLAAFLRSARGLLQGYFAVEDPRRLEPAERESLVSTLVDDELLIRGYIDRLDISPAGDLRVVDYKTGGAPREAFEGRALFQLKFYALVLWRTRGVVPKVLRLLYLKDAEVCDYSPDAEELERFERTLIALSQAVERAKRDRDFRPKPSRLCGWCNHQRFCPEFGGTPPPYPEPTEAAPPAADLIADPASPAPPANLTADPASPAPPASLIADPTSPAPPASPVPDPTSPAPPAGVAADEASPAPANTAASAASPVPPGDLPADAAAPPAPGRVAADIASPASAGDLATDTLDVGQPAPHPDSVRIEPRAAADPLTSPPRDRPVVAAPPAPAARAEV
jgi:putative RecB family exonuclease